MSLQCSQLDVDVYKRQHLDIVFSKLRNANLVLNYDKCEFGKSQIKFLGHIISADGVSTDPELLQDL